MKSHHNNNRMELSEYVVPQSNIKYYDDGNEKGLFNVCCGLFYMYIIWFTLFVFSFQILHRILPLKRHIAVDFFCSFG